MNGQIKYHLRINSNIDYKTCLDQRATCDFKGFYHLVQTMLLKHVTLFPGHVSTHMCDTYQNINASSF